MACIRVVGCNLLFCLYRNQQEGNLDSEFRYSGRDLISVAEVNNTSTSKQVSSYDSNDL